MGETRPFDDSLRGIVIDSDALKLPQELVAVADARAEPPGRPRLGERALHSVFAQGVGACPFRRLAVRPALHPGVQRALSAESGEDVGGAARIIARTD